MVGYTYSTIKETRNEVKAKCEKKSSCKTNEGAFFEMHHQLISSQGLKRSKIRGPSLIYWNKRLTFISIIEWLVIPIVP